MKTIKIGVSGEQGSFSEMAGQLYIEKNNLNADIHYLIDMERVLAAVDAKQIDIGIFPVINWTGGIVKMAFEAMGKYHFRYIDNLWLDVQQCLMTSKQTEPTEIKNIVSHIQALTQCKNYLTTHFPKAQITPWEDTAKAAKDLAENKLPPDSAVIAPAHAAELYHLKMIAVNIQDIKPNYTVFVVTQPRED